MEPSNVQVSMPKGDIPFLRKIAKEMGWTVTTSRKTGVEAGLEDIEAGRVYHAANAADMISQILG